MIRDLSQTMQTILTQPGLPEPLSKAEISFEPPSEKFAPDKTTLNLFLYDIRENTDLRSNERTQERSQGQVLTHRPPLRVACSYLLTAWAVGGADLALQEQRLLSQALLTLSRYPTIPMPFLRGGLLGQTPPLPMLVARPDGLSNPAEFWSALGSKLRPSLTVIGTIALDVFAPVAAPMVITEEIRLEQRERPETEIKFFRIGGRISGAGGAPVAEATVLVVELNLQTTSDSEGRYSLGPASAGQYTLRVRFQATERKINITVPAPAGKNYDVQLG